MDPSLHKAAVQGGVASLRKLVAERPGILSSKTPRGNTALHNAAELGHTYFAQEALGVNDSLLLSKNADGDTPLHLASRAGQLDVVDLLISREGALPAEHPHPLLMSNKAGDTPLHAAVKHGRSAMALKLLDAEPGRSHALNVEKLSPLHIAAREGLADVVAKIVSQPWVHERYDPSDSGTPLHQAILGGHTRKYTSHACLS
ncbi:unnamed protein product [Triticum turgidum subsp. durum]|uniref:Uncharacterized protein n=1 Tax=Triticum turgidum subsp. durum TaxID=4567 RepID=A0A9R1PXN4_TRITD|nr:unnamed protein product [Triticum turgidum subsp. durum]